MMEFLFLVSVIQNAACLTQLSLFFVLLWSDEMSVHGYAVLGVFVIPSNHCQNRAKCQLLWRTTESQCSAPSQPAPRSWHTDHSARQLWWWWWWWWGGGVGGVQMFVLAPSTTCVSHINSKTRSKIHAKIKVLLWDLSQNFHVFRIMINKWTKIVDILKWICFL